MSIRHLTLEEWFTYYQLRQIEKRHFHLSSFVEADVSALQAAYAPEAFPLTFILIKALALTLKHEPAINRQLVYTFWGAPRLRQAESCSINVPILINYAGQDYLSLTVVRDAEHKSVSEIKAEIKAFYGKQPQDLPVGKYVIGKKNTVFNRTRLKIIQWIVSHLPHLHDKYNVGTASVSSLLNLDHAGTEVCVIGRGPGGFSITASHFDAATGRVKLGLAWDHYTGPGRAGIKAAMTLCRVLQGEIDPVALMPAGVAAASGTEA